MGDLSTGSDQCFVTDPMLEQPLSDQEEADGVASKAWANQLTPSAELAGDISDCSLETEEPLFLQEVDSVLLAASADMSDCHKRSATGIIVY